LKDEVAAVLVIVLVIVGAGAGYLLGRSNQRVTTSITTSTFPTTITTTAQPSALVSATTAISTSTFTTAFTSTLTTTLTSNVPSLYETFTAYPISEPNGRQEWDGNFSFAVYEVLLDTQGSDGRTICYSPAPPKGSILPISCSGYVGIGFGAEPTEIVTTADGDTVWAVHSSECDWYNITANGQSYGCHFYLTYFNTYTFVPGGPATWDGAYAPVLSGKWNGTSQEQWDYSVATTTDGGGSISIYSQWANGTFVSAPQTLGPWTLTSQSSFPVTGGSSTFQFIYNKG
jgi:hypothetical protein